MKHSHRLLSSAAAVVLGLSALGMTATASAACQPQAAKYDIKAERLDTALQDFAHISGCPVKVDTSILGDRKASALQGTYTPPDALVRLVRGTGLEAHVDNNQYSVNHSDREALTSQVKSLRQQVQSAAGNGKIAKKTAKKLDAKLKKVKNESIDLIRKQGFLSAAEKASNERLFAYVKGQLAPQNAS